MLRVAQDISVGLALLEQLPNDGDGTAAVRSILEVQCPSCLSLVRVRFSVHHALA
jgi:hypothetical protein